VERLLSAVAGFVSLSGILLAYLLFLRFPQIVHQVMEWRPVEALYHLWQVGWGFDWLDNQFIVRPFVWLARMDKDDVVDLFYDGVAWLTRGTYRALSWTQTGHVRLYTAVIVSGAILLTALVVLL